MTPVEIHNGQILVDGQAQAEAPVSPVKAELPLVTNLDPDEIARRMAAAISERQGLQPPPTPMDLVNVLLNLAVRDQKGIMQKLVWTRFDVQKAMGLLAQKLTGTAAL